MREELRGKGLKSPSKLLSPKYLSQSSLAEQNRNPSSPKRVHFINSIVILNKEGETKEEGNVKTSTTEHEDHEMTMESEEEFNEETKNEIKEEEVKGLKVFVGNFTYECDFMVLEDTTSVTNHDLGSVIFGKPFIEATGLVYDREEGTITFEKDKEKIMFKMPNDIK
ncbi:MAK10-like protein [Tanacetum coccineum]